MSPCLDWHCAGQETPGDANLHKAAHCKNPMTSSWDLLSPTFISETWRPLLAHFPQSSSLLWLEEASDPAEAQCLFSPLFLPTALRD